MPSNARWRRFKIVAPSPSRAQEISGGLKNALNRGETLAKAKQTFINGGYTSREVQDASQLIKSKPMQMAKPLNPSEPQSQSELQPQPSRSKKSSSKKTIIILSIVGTVILITALILGIFWDKIF